MMTSVKCSKLFENMLAAARILLRYRCRGHCKFLFLFIVIIDVVVIAVVTVVAVVIDVVGLVMFVKLFFTFNAIMMSCN